ncbi:iron ABC transporter permease [Hoeflea sp. CAU 1731]
MAHFPLTASRSARSGAGLPVLALVISVFVLIPVVALFVIALTGSSEDWPHLIRYVIPQSIWTTVLLLLGVAVLTGSMGILSAWLVVSCDFPFRRLLSWALVLPFAVPTYLAAYAYVEFLDYTGPVQSAIRAIFGYTSGSQYSFPEARSLWGAAMILSFVLFPYVYLTCRAVFLMQGKAAVDAARTLGVGRLGAFFRVQLPMARPALAIGITLALMESLNDIGAVEYLGVNTLTFSIYDTWLNRGSLAGAAQIACAMLIIAFGCVVFERWARRRQRFNVTRTTGAVFDTVPQKLTGPAAWAATVACALPILAGFGIPFYILGGFALKRLEQFSGDRLYAALFDSLYVSTVTTLITVVVAFVIAYAARVSGSRIVAYTGRIASFGYAIPGTVLALGVLIPLAGLDNLINLASEQMFGVKVGLLLTGSGAAIIYACSIRFLTMAEGSVDAGFHKLSPNLDMAARTLGRNRSQTFISVLLPMMRPAAMTAALLVFVDTMKELSATLLLRPFNFNTLATLVYEDASRARVEDAAPAALIIMLVGILPVILISRTAIRRPSAAPLYRG